MRVIGRRDLASGGEIQFPRGAEGELNSRETASAQKMFTATDARVCATGGKYGSRSSAVVVRCTPSNNHPTRGVLALTQLEKIEAWQAFGSR